LNYTQLRLVVLYADVTGSTHLYEIFGDAIASTDIHACLDLLTNIAEVHGGKKVKTIGDEVMCSFQRPDKAAQAAMQMNQQLSEASEDGRFQSGELHIKIGWHYGRGTYRQDDIIGEAAILAQQVIKMAKRDEILTTQKSIDELPAIVKSTAIFIDRVEADDGSGDFDVYSLPWDNNDSEATMVGSATTSHAVTGGLVHSALILSYKDQRLALDPHKTHCHFGRGEDNEIVVLGKFTSRHHAEIYYRHGRFHLADMSTNGTGIIHEGDNFVRLHREEKMLAGLGTICFGGEPGVDPEAAVQYECIRVND